MLIKKMIDWNRNPFSRILIIQLDDGNIIGLQSINDKPYPEKFTELSFSYMMKFLHEYSSSMKGRAKKFNQTDLIDEIKLYDEFLNDIRNLGGRFKYGCTHCLREFTEEEYKLLKKHNYYEFIACPDCDEPVCMSV